jgi:hypothetical protein
MHSIPKYPSIDLTTGKINHLSPSSSQYGQSVICHTIKSEEQARALFNQIKESKPGIFHDTFISNRVTLPTVTKSLAGRGNSLKKLFELGKNFKKAQKVVEPIEQKIGDFTFVTKPHKLKGQIFEEFLGPFWKAKLGQDIGFYIETWGRPLIPSLCDTANPMINITKLSIHDEQQKETQDHSKWAISTGEIQNVVCIGDLNH